MLRSEADSADVFVLRACKLWWFAIAERALNTLAAAVTDWSEDRSKREALVQLGRSVLIKWLLSRALDAGNSLEQIEAEHALLNLLADGELKVAVVTGA